MREIKSVHGQLFGLGVRTISPFSSMVILGTGRSGIGGWYLACFRSPVRVRAPRSTMSARSRLAVAEEVLAIVTYLLALSPPLNPDGPSRSNRSRTFSWRAFSL